MFVYSRALVHLPGGHAGNFTNTLRHGDSSTVAGYYLDCGIAEGELIGWMTMDPYRIHVTLDPISMTMKTQLWRRVGEPFSFFKMLYFLLPSLKGKPQYQVRTVRWSPRHSLPIVAFCCVETTSALADVQLRFIGKCVCMPELIV